MIDTGFLLNTLLPISISIFAIMDPPAAIPTLISYIGSLESSRDNIDEAVKRVVGRVFVAVFILLTVFSLAGEYVLKFFNIDLASLKIAGGVLLMAVAVDMLITGHKPENISGGDLAVVPIATPLIVGPGTMSTLIVYSRIYGSLTTLAGAYIALLITYPILRYSYKIFRFLGTSTLQGLGKFMSLIIASIAVTLVIGGLKDLGLLSSL
ncbi:MAG: MarC family protein [Sulfolobales archaeon]